MNESALVNRVWDDAQVLRRQAKNPALPCPSNASRKPFDRRAMTIFQEKANPEGR